MKDPLRTKEEIDSYSVIWAEAQNFGKQQSFGMADNSQSRGDVYQSRGFPPGGAPRRGGYGGGVKPAAMGGAYGGGYGGGMGNYYNYPNNMWKSNLLITIRKNIKGNLIKKKIVNFFPRKIDLKNEIVLPKNEEIIRCFWFK